MIMALEGVLPADADTLLVISGLGGFQYQARGLSQSFTPITEQKQLKRSIVGTLIDISDPIFRKLATVITCTDVDAPPLDGLWIGMPITVDCAAWLCYKTGNTGSPWYVEVSGSGYVQGDYTFYRPVIDMLVTDIKQTEEEWKSDHQWELHAEEV